MQSVQCNSIANPCICTTVTIGVTATAIIMVITALKTIINTIIRNYYEGHDAYKVTKVIAAIMAKTVIIVIITTTAITAIITSKNCWLYKISETYIFTSWSLKIMHLRLNVWKTAFLCNWCIYILKLASWCTS